MRNRLAPRLLVVVTGTGTDIGKTWLTCALCRDLRARGLKVAARKPAQSFDQAAAENCGTDAELLAAATEESAAVVCPRERWYPKAMAPPMAAESIGLPQLLLQDLLGGILWPEGTDVGFVELAGGAGSPQAADADGVETTKALAPDLVVLVAHARLGALSDIRLAVRALSGHELMVYLNGFDPADELHIANQRWLCERWGLTVFTSADSLARALVGRSNP